MNATKKPAKNAAAKPAKKTAAKKPAKKTAAKPAKKAAAKPAKKAAARPSGKRRFEFSEGSSNKFWEIQVSGEGFTTRHGKIGTDGTEVKKGFSSPEEATKEAEKLVREKVKKGYVEK